MKVNNDREWLKRQAALEDGDFVSVGGFVESMGVEELAGAQNVIPLRSAFARLIQLARRERNLSCEQFAARVDVDLAEVLGIEADEHYRPALRTVHQIANFLGIPDKKLLGLSGLLKVKDAQFQKAALQFAARAEPVEKLSQEEHSALEEYVKFLCER